MLGDFDASVRSRILSLFPMLILSPSLSPCELEYGQKRVWMTRPWNARREKRGGRRRKWKKPLSSKETDFQTKVCRSFTSFSGRCQEDPTFSTSGWWEKDPDSICFTVTVCFWSMEFSILNSHSPIFFFRFSISFSLKVGSFSHSSPSFILLFHIPFTKWSGVWSP